MELDKIMKKYPISGKVHYKDTLAGVVIGYTRPVLGSKILDTWEIIYLGTSNTNKYQFNERSRNFRVV